MYKKSSKNLKNFSFFICVFAKVFCLHFILKISIIHNSGLICRFSYEHYSHFVHELKFGRNAQIDFFVGLWYNFLSHRCRISFADFLGDAFQQILAFFPVRKHNLQKQIKLFGVILMNKMTKLMCDNVFYAVFRKLNQLFIESDNALIGMAAPPA